MRLLLLLSALLAALSGANAAARAPRAEMVEVAARMAAPEREPAHAHVLLASRPRVAPVAEERLATRLVARVAAPRLWMQRRRE